MNPAAASISVGTTKKERHDKPAERSSSHRAHIRSSQPRLPHPNLFKSSTAPCRPAVVKS